MDALRLVGPWVQGAKWRRWTASAALVLLPLGWGACSETASLAESLPGSSGFDGEGDGTGGTASVDAPEVELEETFRAPVVSGQYLWSANPETNKVARINAATLDIEVLEGGHAPTFLSALVSGETPGGALILNEKSQDASVYLVDDEGAVASHSRIGVQRGASAWAVGKQGAFAVAWSRATEGLLNSLDGYQDLTVLDFTGDELAATTLSVGFRPSKVVLNEAETRAYVVSDPGISVIELGDNVRVVRELSLPEETQAQARDVAFTADGRLSLVRLGGSSDVLLVDTETDERVTVQLPGPVTDLDLSADGSTAVAVVRGGQTVPNGGIGGAGGAGGEPVASVSHVALLPVATIFEEPATFTIVSTDETVGSAVVSEDASQVLLFTNAVANSRLSILDADSGELRVVDLRSPVRAAFISPDAAHAVALLSTPAGSSKAGAFALIPVKDELPWRIEGTETAPEFVSISSEFGRVMVTTKATATQKASIYFGRIPGGRVDRIELPSKPLAAGMAPEAGQGFVAQEHAEGRVTFVALETGIEKTVTGFELSSKVVQ